MCGRYVFYSDKTEVQEEFDGQLELELVPRYNISPMQPVGIIRQNPFKHEPEKQFALVRWGLIPSWSKDGQVGNGRPLSNARVETITEKPSFKNAFRRRRCLIPANGFYEWTGEAGSKQPWFISIRGQDLFAFAGIWEHWLGANGSEMETVAMITRPAGPAIENLHHREPLVIAPEDYDVWLHADERDKTHYEALLKTPYPDWQAWPVAKAVNSGRAEGADLMQRIEPERPATQADLF